MCRPAAGYYINVYNPPEKQNKTKQKRKNLNIWLNKRWWVNKRDKWKYLTLLLLEWRSPDSCRNTEKAKWGDIIIISISSLKTSIIIMLQKYSSLFKNKNLVWELCMLLCSRGLYFCIVGDLEFHLSKWCFVYMDRCVEQLYVCCCLCSSLPAHCVKLGESTFLKKLLSLFSTYN